jgi:type II secretory pathway predicted ATPase ExeA
MLKRDELEALSRRLSHVAVLRNLSREEARAYILHRMAIVGARTDLFDPMAMEALHELARGNLRTTDTLAFKALHIAAAAKAPVVDANHVALARSQVLS